MNNIPQDIEYIVIENFLTSKECDNYIKYIDKLFEDMVDIDGLEIDGYQRVRIINKELSIFIEERLSTYYDISNIYLGDKWFPTKYIKNGGLCIHIDGNAYDETNVSLYSALLYLNNDFNGGRTVIVNDYDDEEIITDTTIIIKPEKGKLLILNQNILHFAEKINSGEKYILRGDMFSK
jgi:hypothetical protein